MRESTGSPRRDPWGWLPLWAFAAVVFAIAFSLTTLPVYIVAWRHESIGRFSYAHGLIFAGMVTIDMVGVRWWVHVRRGGNAILFMTALGVVVVGGVLFTVTP